MRKVFVLIIFFGVLSVGWYTWSLRPLDPRSEIRRTVKIAPGSSVAVIADLLEEKGVIRSSFAFKIYVKIHGIQTALQAGSFVLHPSMSATEVAEALRTGIAAEAIITIPEGYTVLDMDRLLAGRGIITAGQLKQCANNCDFSSFPFLPKKKTDFAMRGGRVEGYLYPDTYFVVVDGFSPKFFLERLLSTFEKHVLQVFKEDLAHSKRSLHEIVTMASLIEKETRTEEERPIVSGILWKRYDAGKGLDVDAAVRYVLEKPTDALTTTDLNISSPYNIRKFRGLPPGPIASPSISSIRAALSPKGTEYWYYLHGSDGKIHYAVTNEEHNVNRYKYLR